MKREGLLITEQVENRGMKDKGQMSRAAQLQVGNRQPKLMSGLGTRPGPLSRSIASLIMVSLE